MKKGLLILVALSIAVLVSASMLVAQEKAPVEKEMGTCKKEMKLTDEQKAKIEEMKMNFRLKMIDLKAERQKLGIALKKEMMKSEPAMKDIESVVKKISTVREKMQLTRIEHLLAMRKMLGPDACKRMHFGTAGGCGMHGMGCGDEGECGHMMCRHERDGDDDEGMPARRAMRMRMKAPGCGMEKGLGHEGCAHGEADREVECTVKVIKEEVKK